MNPRLAGAALVLLLVLIAPAAADPPADFVANVTTGYADLSVNFTDLSEPPWIIDTWSWTFGDGSNSTLQHPNHTYTAPGRYTVSLTILNTSGNRPQATETKEGYISVYEGGLPLLIFISILLGASGLMIYSWVDDWNRHYANILAAFLSSGMWFWLAGMISSGEVRNRLDSGWVTIQDSALSYLFTGLALIMAFLTFMYVLELIISSMQNRRQ